MASKKKKPSSKKPKDPKVEPPDTRSEDYKKSIAKEGSKTKGTTIGDAREINAAQMAPAREVTAPEIGAIERAQAANLDPAALVPQSNVFRDQQLSLAQGIQDQLSGKAPSVAQLQLQQTLERNKAGQMGALAAQRGVNAGLAARIIGRQAGQLDQDAAMQSAILRAQENQANQAALATLAGQGREGDTAVDVANQGALNSFSTNRAALAQQIALENAKASNQRQAEQADVSLRGSLANQQAVNQQNFNQAQLNQQAAQGNQSAFNTANINQANIAGGVKQAELGANATLGASENALAGTKYTADTSVVNNAINNVGQSQDAEQESGQPKVTTQPSGGNRLGIGNRTSRADEGISTQVVSDERAKKNIESGDSATEDMLSNLASAIFEYKNKNNGEGRQLGVMAQDLEKSKLGKEMVDEEDGTKYIDFKKGLSSILSAQANLHKRLSQLEGKRA